MPLKFLNRYLPVIMSLSQVMETIDELLIPDAANAGAWGNCHSSAVEPACPLNMRMNVPLVEFNEDFPC